MPIRHAKGDRVRIRTITSEMPAVVLVDQGGPEVAVRPLYHSGPGEQRNIRRTDILRPKTLYRVALSKVSSHAAIVECASLAAAMKVASDAMAESPNGELANFIAVRSASAHQVFTARHTDENGWQAMDDRAVLR